MKNFLVVSEDVRQSPYVFFDFDRRYGLKIREQYLDLRCKECGKINEVEALERGIPAAIVISKKMPDFFSSSEGIKIVSRETRLVLDSINHVNIRYYPFPSDPKFFFALPENLIPVTTDNAAFRTEGYCSRCKRVGSCTLGPELYLLPADFVIGAFLFECETNVTPLWLACEHVVISLKRAKLKGLEFHPYFKIA